MITEQITALLIAERDKLNAAIAALGAPVKRRGRPPGIKKVLVFQGEQHEFKPIPKPRRQRTPAERKATSLKMKAAWAKRKAAA